MAAMMRFPVHVEAQIKDNCTGKQAEIAYVVEEKLKASHPVFQNGQVEFDQSDIIHQYCDSVTIGDIEEGQVISFWQAELCVHAFRLSDQEPEKDFIDGEDELPAAEQWELPNRLLCGLWESIIVEPVVKQRLLGYCSSSLQFSNAGVDSTIISWNRMVLLHGPPGTGKTTICKALAQKVYIRNCDRYSSGVLLEVNSHSLFSKWFSESGKLVMKLFDHIHEIAEDEDCFVAVLIDEVESIAASRNSSARSNEPGDAVRVVNAVLTSLDALRRRPNVLVLCTSNMVDAIDSAFRDRVDLQVYLGPPNTAARYQILRSCIVELMGSGIIQPSVPLGMWAEETSSSIVSDNEENASMERILYDVATHCNGMSGRGLRKLPLKAHAFYLQRPVVTLEEFLRALLTTARQENIGTEREGKDIIENM